MRVCARRRPSPALRLHGRGNRQRRRGGEARAQQRANWPARAPAAPPRITSRVGPAGRRRIFQFVHAALQRIALVLCRLLLRQDTKQSSLNCWHAA